MNCGCGNTKAGEVVAVSVGSVCTEPKQDQGWGIFRAGYGIEGDSHAGLSEREISLLGVETIRKLNIEHDAGAIPGSFAENVTTMGIDLPSLALGQKLLVGEALLEVVQIGKPLDEAHTYNFKGYSLLPTHGIFCRVVESGQVRRGDGIYLVFDGHVEDSLGGCGCTGSVPCGCDGGCCS